MEKGLEAGLKEGIRQGAEQSQRETAAKMLQREMDPLLISEPTGLSVDAVMARTV